jgi:Ig-like domain from next to BRCA1 gene
MKITTNSILILFGLIGLMMVACLPVAMLASPLFRPSQPTPNSFATLQAIVTQTMMAMPTSVPATATPLPPTSAPVLTNTPVPTATAVSYCDWVNFIKDVTIPDGTKFAPGETFTKTWRLKNRGTCTWTSDYMLVFTSGDPMGSTTAVRLPGNVAPGQTVDVSVTLTAPAKRGDQVGYWMLRNSSGLLFGYGDRANQAFYVDINVDDLPYGSVTGNFYYPSEFNPLLALYFENVGTGEVILFSIPEKTPAYNVLLPNGTYYVYAWAPGYNLQGAYVNDNLTMRPLIVKGGQTTSGINLTDWGPYPHSRG